jgi:hypothetical protein
MPNRSQMNSTRARNVRFLNAARITFRDAVMSYSNSYETGISGRNLLV